MPGFRRRRTAGDGRLMAWCDGRMGGLLPLKRNSWEVVATRIDAWLPPTPNSCVSVCKIGECRPVARRVRRSQKSVGLSVWCLADLAGTAARVDVLEVRTEAL